MVRMSEKERAHQKMLLRGLENLSDLGGFIKEQIEDEIYDLYPSIVATMTEKYCPLGPGFWDVADAIENAIKETDKYADYVFDEDGDPYEVPNPEFDEWVINQIARITTENNKCGKSYFWSGWKLTRETRKALMRLNALDERVLYLFYGIDEKHKLTAKQISELPEFSCTEEYINKVIEAVEKTLNRCEWGNEEFIQVCDAHRTR